MQKKKLPKAKTTATKSLKPFTNFCFDMQSCVNLKLYELVCKCMTALLTLTEKRLKESRQNKRLYKIL